MTQRLAGINGAIRKKDLGFSLVELMISITLGLVLLAGVISIFLSSKSSFKTQESMGQVQETGRFLNYLFYHYIRLSGYLPDPRNQIDPVTLFGGSWLQIQGSDNSFFASGVTGISGVKSGTDALLVSYAGRTEITGEFSIPICIRATGAATSNRIGGTQIGANVFYVSSPDAKGVSSLNCGVATTAIPATGAVAITNTQPLLYGVQDMQILYGVDTDPADDLQISTGTSGLFPNEYFTANLVTDWRRVASVRITVSVDGIEKTEGAGTGDNTDFVEDGRLRRTFTTTINIRNRLRV